MLFLRFTETPRSDLERNQSIHATDADSLEEAANRYGGACEDYVLTKTGVIGQKINGLCGFALESETLAEALEEIQQEDYIQYAPSQESFTIYDREFSEDNIPDGDVFHAEKILLIKKYT